MREETLLIALALASVPAAAQSPYRVDPKVISCSPRVVQEGSAITVRLGKQHGRELAVYREQDQAWFFLVVELPPAGTPQVMTVSEFADAPVVTLPGTLESVPWASGETSQQRVFSRPGNYRIIVGDNLESEHPGHDCKVRITSARPK